MRSWRKYIALCVVLLSLCVMSATPQTQNFPGGSTSAFPATVSGATSGGIPCFTSSTQMSSSAALAANTLVKGGGAGACVSNSNVTENGTTLTTADGISAGSAGFTVAQSNGAVTSAGNIISSCGGCFLGISGAFFIGGPSNGVIELLNSGGTDFNRLQMGGTTASFPALQKNSTTVQAELADGSAQTTFSASKFLTETNCSSGATPAVCGSAAAGSVAIPAGATQTLVVQSTKVTAASNISLTIDASAVISATTCNTTVATLGAVIVTARSVGVSFTIEEPVTTAVNPVCVDYLLTN